MTPPSTPSTTITAPTSNQLSRRLRSISLKNVVGAIDSVIGQAPSMDTGRNAEDGSGLEAEVDLRDGGVLLGDLEVVACVEAEDPCQQRVREGLDRRVVLPDGAVVVLPREADLVLCGRQLLLQLHDVLVRLELWVVLDQGEQLTQGASQDVLSLGRLTGCRGSRLLCAHRGVTGLDDLGQRVLLELHV